MAFRKVFPEGERIEMSLRKLHDLWNNLRNRLAAVMQEVRLTDEIQADTKELRKAINFVVFGLESNIHLSL